MELLKRNTSAKDQKQPNLPNFVIKLNENYNLKETRSI